MITPTVEHIDRTNGNGHSNGNGHFTGGLTPAQQAWATAKEEAREQGRSVRDDEIRCIKNKGLSCWAKLLYWIVSKICWEKSPFLHNRRVGSVCITGRQLQLHFNFPQKRLYAQTKKTKDAGGKVVATRRVPGAISELETAGLIWMSHKRIENIPSNKWPNVFNLTALVPQETQEALGLLEGVVVDHATDGGSSLFLPENQNGSGQTPQNGLGKHQRADLAATNGGSGQTPLAGVGCNRRGELATTDGGSSAATNGGSSQTPTGGAAKPRQRELANPASRAPNRLSDLKTDSTDYGTGEAPPPKSALEDGLKLPSFPPIPADIFKSKLLQLLKDTEQSLKKLRAQSSVTEKVPGKNIVWCETEAARIEKSNPKKARELRAKAAKLRRDDDAWVKRVKVSPNALPFIEVYTQRVADIKDRLESGQFVP